MNESEFNTLADQTLAAIEQALDGCGADLDYELKAGGVLEIVCADGSKVIVNRHGAAREIWVAAKSGGFHFAPVAGRWVSARDGSELVATLCRCLSEQSGETVALAIS
ncbi:iron donor protein CyaY [Denitratisoma sp. DHT3]|uniref:iron donor protein CyaY n=1 Tax=Denitratisoma sp. DHT3 TaxID=1981880 RepID=UPI001198B5BA|nr:iron donor protein CyaY [Denitratisoma sp. DHT3]QDX79915.1 iron donor protein CyaY [Denitratisoma sp. DHT3]